MCSTCTAQTANVRVEGWDLGVIDEAMKDSNNTRDVFDSIMIVPDIINWSWQKFFFCTVFLSTVYIPAICKWTLYFLVATDWISALATCVELVVACPCALAGVMNFAWAQGKVTLLVLRVFRVEAFTISPLCHHLNYLAAYLIHTSAASVHSGRLGCKLHTFWEMIN